MRAIPRGTATICLIAFSLIQEPLTHIDTTAGILAAQWRATLTIPGVERLVVVVLLMYFLASTLLRLRPTAYAHLWPKDAYFFLTQAVLLTVLNCLLDAGARSGSLEAIVLLFGALAGRSANLAVDWQTSSRESEATINRLVISIALLLTIVSLLSASNDQNIRYRGNARSTGPWQNPNTYGLLTGVSTILNTGLIISSFRFPMSKVRFMEWARRSTYATAAAVALLGAMSSYSRGAWVGIGCGGAILAFQAFLRFVRNATRKEIISHLAISFACLLLSGFALAFFELRYTQNAILRRLFSILDLNDFSWRNRVATWNACLQMMGDRPWFGCGWELPKDILGTYYLANGHANPSALQTNDFLMLGAALGVPAFVMFVLFFLLSLCNEDLDGDGYQRYSEKASWLRATCRSAVVVFLVGFWFDGGLFQIATAIPFWILIELGRSS